VTEPSSPSLLVLSPDPVAVRRARTFVRMCCEATGLDGEACDAAVLLTSETVTNAFTHGRSEARLSVTARPGVLLVEVSDDNSRHPFLADHDNDALDGRGLKILDVLAARWGVREERLGKVVWFEIAASS
jgi:anti-sigma regulatory factor (Ser/Thr protein kinase)